jgi:hypothetical protein
VSGKLAAALFFMHYSGSPFEGALMPRPAKIWRRGQNGCYYATIDGKQERLSYDYGEALDLFHTLKKAAAKCRRGKPAHAPKLSITLGEIADGFLDHGKLTKSEKTYDNQRHYLQSFCDRVGKRKPARDITGQDLDDWSLRAVGGSPSKPWPERLSWPVSIGPSSAAR